MAFNEIIWKIVGADLSRTPPIYRPHWLIVTLYTVGANLSTNYLIVILSGSEGSLAKGRDMLH